MRRDRNSSPAPLSERGGAGAATVWFHCFAGIAGDMALGALIDAGADVGEIRRLLERIPIGGWDVEVEPVLRNGIAATQVLVHAQETSVVRTFAHISGLLEEARLPTRTLRRAISAFGALAEVEGRLHRRPPAQVHFHEVGGIDAIVDIVGTCAALEVLGVEQVCASPVATGMGIVRTAHGLLPNPAPAVVELLRDAPTYGVDLAVELTTPTGAALLATLVSSWGPLPAMTIHATGYGAGTRELDDLPNVTQVVIGRAAMEHPDHARASGETPGQPLVLLETNVDDATGETLAHAIERFFEAGALDAWLTPIVMKKGRPAFTVSVLCDATLTRRLRELLVAETGTLGVRGRSVDRWPAPRSTDVVEVEGMLVRVKISPGRVKVEHDDAARLAQTTGLPLREVLRRAELAWHERRDDHAESGESWRGPADNPA